MMVKALGEFCECYKRDSVLEGRRAGVHVGAREEVSQDRVGAGPWPGSPARQHCARARGRSRHGTDASGATRGRPDTDFAQGQCQKSHPFFFSFIRSHASRTHQMPSKQTRDGPAAQGAPERAACPPRSCRAQWVPARGQRPRRCGFREHPVLRATG